MSQEQPHARERGDVIVLRYITTDGRVEMCWPCRVVQDSSELIALFIAAGSLYKAGPKKTAAEKRCMKQDMLPPDEYVWRKDTLRLMLPERHHSVFLFWDGIGEGRSFSNYFINMEEPFRRTAIGIDTQDHTLDIVVTPNLNWMWRDEDELESHVRHGFYTSDLAKAARQEGERVVTEITQGTHPCLDGWERWLPDPSWEIPRMPAGWDTTPATFWNAYRWAYGDSSSFT